MMMKIQKIKLTKPIVFALLIIFYFLIMYGFHRCLQRPEKYERYSETVLTDLAEKGDVEAIDALSYRALENGNIQLTIFYLKRAVIFGSTTDFANLAIYTQHYFGQDNTEEQRRRAALETLAVSTVAEIRGDARTARLAHNSFIQGYKQIYGVDLVLSHEEQQLVEARAQEMYNSYQQVRYEKGLGDFDNTGPSAFMKLIGLR